MGLFETVVGFFFKEKNAVGTFSFWLILVALVLTAGSFVYVHETSLKADAEVANEKLAKQEITVKALQEKAMEDRAKLIQSTSREETAVAVTQLTTQLNDAKDQASLNRQENDQLVNKKAAAIIKKLPPTQKKDNGAGRGVKDQSGTTTAAADPSLTRINLLWEAYCNNNTEQPECKGPTS